MKRKLKQHLEQRPHVCLRNLIITENICHLNCSTKGGWLPFYWFYRVVAHLLFPYPVDATYERDKVTKEFIDSE